MSTYLLYRLGQFLACSLPYSVTCGLANIITDIKYFVSVRDRYIVKNNLNAILGRDCKNIDQMVRETFRNFGRYLVDFFRLSKADRCYIEKILEIEGLSHIEEALKKGKGVIAISAHLGNWELGGIAMALLGYPMSAVVLDHKNKMVNRLFIESRTRAGGEVIPLRFAARQSINSLVANRMLAILGDRDFTNNGIRMNFLGKETIIPKGPAVFALKTGAELICVFVVQKPSGGYLMTFEPPITKGELSGDFDKDVRSLTERFVKIMESYIRRYPTQWLMFRQFWV